MTQKELYQQIVTEEFGPAKEKYNERQSENPRYVVTQRKGDFFVTEDNNIRVKKGVPVKIYKWCEPVIERKEIDGEIWEREISEARRKTVYEYAYQELENRRFYEHNFYFRLLGLEYKFTTYDGMSFNTHSQNDHIDLLCNLFNCEVFDNRIKCITTGKKDRWFYRIRDRFSAMERFEFWSEKWKLDIFDIEIPILYDDYGWSNCAEYYISLDTLFKLDYALIQKYDKRWIEIFSYININLNWDYEKKVKAFNKLLEINKKVTPVRQFYSAVERKDPDKFCYIIKNKRNGLYKIGYSSNPLLREQTLQSQEPELESVKIFKNNHESELHERYDKQRVRGEWFKLTNVQLKYICTHYE